MRAVARKGRVRVWQLMQMATLPLADDTMMEEREALLPE
jgi:hypothetical protein